MLSQLVTEFTRKHEGKITDEETGETTTVQQQSYWQQLLDIVEHGNGESTGGSSHPSRILGDQDARELQINITRTVNEQWPGAGRRHLLRKPVPEKIRLWSAHVQNNQDKAQHLANLLSRWIGQIDGLETKAITQFPPCPDCEREHIWIYTSTGRKQHQALESDGQSVWCNACEKRWEGIPGMKLLARILWQGNDTESLTA